MNRKLVLLAAMAAALPVASMATAFHGPTTTSLCVAAGSAPNILDDPALKALNGQVTVSAQQQTWLFTLGAGTHYLLSAFLFDADLSVCKVGDSRHACISGNIAFVPDTCTTGATGNPGTGRPLTGPGTFRLDVIYCWASNCYDLDPSLDQPIDYVIVVV